MTIPDTSDPALDTQEVREIEAEEDAEIETAIEADDDDPKTSYQGPRGGTSLAAILLVRLGLLTPDEVQVLWDQEAEERRKANPIAELLERSHTVAQIGEASRTIAQLIVSNQLSAAEGRTALYALQITLTAANLTEAAAARSDKKAARAKPRRRRPAAKKRRRKTP